MESFVEHYPSDPAAAEARWYACYTRARHEKRVNEVLRTLGLESYLPVVPLLRQWKDRRQLVEFPMFPSYVFVRTRPAELSDVDAVPGVCWLVRSQGEPVAIPDGELENVRRLANALRKSGGGVAPVTRLAEGQWVEIADGPFQGLRGIVVAQRNPRRVIVGLRAIGQGIEVAVATSTLVPVSAPE